MLKSMSTITNYLSNISTGKNSDIKIAITKYPIYSIFMSLNTTFVITVSFKQLYMSTIKAKPLICSCCWLHHRDKTGPGFFYVLLHSDL